MTPQALYAPKHPDPLLRVAESMGTPGGLRLSSAGLPGQQAGCYPSAERRWGKISFPPAGPLLITKCVGEGTELSDLRVTFRAIKGSRVSSTVPLPQKQPEDEGAASRAEK